MHSPLLQIQVEANRVEHTYGKAHLDRLLAVFEFGDESRVATARVRNISLCEALSLSGGPQSHSKVSLYLQYNICLSSNLPYKYILSIFREMLPYGMFLPQYPVIIPNGNTGSRNTLTNQFRHAMTHKPSPTMSRLERQSRDRLGTRRPDKTSPLYLR